MPEGISLRDTLHKGTALKAIFSIIPSIEIIEMIATPQKPLLSPSARAIP
jgi:hypothetical protein